jgi:hypothetical protein
MMFHPQVDEHDQVVEPSCCAAFAQLVALPWKLAFATIPPRRLASGWLTLLACVAWICFLTFCCSELIENIVCLLEFNNCIAGLILVSFGCAIPEIVASARAAADKTRTNCDDVFLPVVAANAANIFVGLGLPWTIAALHRLSNDDGPIYLGKYEAFDIFFVTATFLVGSLLAYGIFICRRGCLNLDIGGSTFSRFCSSCLLFTIWGVFVLMNILNCYGYFGETFMPWQIFSMNATQLGRGSRASLSSLACLGRTMDPPITTETEEGVRISWAYPADVTQVTDVQVFVEIGGSKVLMDQYCGSNTAVLAS